MVAYNQLTTETARLNAPTVKARRRKLPVALYVVHGELFALVETLLAYLTLQLCAVTSTCTRRMRRSI